MTDSVPQTISSVNRQAYQRLKLALSLGLRRQLFVAVCDDVALQTQLAIELQAEFDRIAQIYQPLRIAHNSRSPAYPRLVSLTLDPAEPDPIVQITQWIEKNPPPSVGSKRQTLPGFQLVGIEQLTRQPATVQWQFLRCLQLIEQNLPILESSLLIWMPRPWLHSVQQSAPEFWDWHTGIFEFVGDPTPARPDLPSPPPVEKLPDSPKVEIDQTPISSQKPLKVSQDIWDILTQDLAKLGESSSNAAEQKGKVVTPIAKKLPSNPAEPTQQQVTAQPPVPSHPKTPPVLQSPQEQPLQKKGRKQEQAQANGRKNPNGNGSGNGNPLSASNGKLQAIEPLTSQALDILEVETDTPASKPSESVQTLQHIHNLHEQKASPAELAAAYRMLGNLYRDRIEAGNLSEENLTLAIQAYEKVLEWLAHDRTLPSLSETGNGNRKATGTCSQTVYLSSQSASYVASVPLASDVMNDLGNLYWMLSRSFTTLDKKLPTLLKSIEVYQVALSKIVPESQPNSYAMIQNNLGAAYGDLARYRGTAANLQCSVNAYQEALRYRQADLEPAKYASTQNNLGTAYWHLAQYQQPVPNLKQAIAAYAAALPYYHPEREAMSYAMIQNNLGTAYWNLAQYEQTDLLLEQAIQAYQEALIYRTVAAAPAAHAATQNNLGTAYWHLAGRQKDNHAIRQNYLEQAIVAYTAALKTAEQHAAISLTFDVFATQNNLGLAHYQVAMDHAFSLNQTSRAAHLEAALYHHLQAAQGWQHQPDFHSTALTYVIQTLRGFYTELGLQGQNGALSKVPGELLGEILPRL
ncbi:MAG: tetratricopeptide repeat protein [Leptolyngbyaceae cyanobacterium bins.59]|nr:tetratricopeptide repeat protein [Leptolyngbyaceae cyanobacterium bins.59]